MVSQYMNCPREAEETPGSVDTASTLKSSALSPGNCERYSPVLYDDRRGALIGVTSSCTIESTTKVTYLRRKGSRYEALKSLNLAPGSSRPCFSSPTVSFGSKNPLRKRCSVTGACPAPPKMMVREKPNSKLSVGRKENISECTQGARGTVCPFRLP